jgi:hypothetical protein
MSTVSPKCAPYLVNGAAALARLARGNCFLGCIHIHISFPGIQWAYDRVSQTVARLYPVRPRILFFFSCTVSLCMMESNCMVSGNALC